VTERDWRERSSPPPLRAGEPHVWRARVSETPDLGSLLSADELARAEALKRGRRRFVAARGLLRKLAGAYLDRDPASLTFALAEHGKPYLADADLRFSVSHSGDLVLIAFSQGNEIGVDVEEIRESSDTMAIARRFFAPEDAAALAALPPSGRTAAFFAIWCRKEAVLKATGKGVSEGLDRFAVSAVDSTQTVRLDDGDPWTVRSLTPAPGHGAAVAMVGGRKPVLLSR